MFSSICGNCKPMGKFKARVEYAEPPKTVECPRCHLEFNPNKAREDSAMVAFFKYVVILVLLMAIAAFIIQVVF